MIRSRGPQKYIALRRLAVWADQLTADSNAELSYFVEGGGELVARCCHHAAHAVATSLLRGPHRHPGIRCRVSRVPISSLPGSFTVNSGAEAVERAWYAVR